jgi:adenylate cyclase
MATAIVTRRLAAILAADVVGYSRLMGADEEGTHERFKAHLREVVDPKIREHHGRIVKHTGDGVLAEFASVVDAVRCAGEIQRAMADRDLDLAAERRLRFRIGVNLGDVIADGGDIYGDGVNVAARLEALAEPGGICVSRTVRDHIRDKLPYPFEDRGEQSVKNIARPVRVYALGPEAVADLPASRTLTSAPHRRSTAATAIGAAVATLLITTASVWWLWPATKPSPAPPAAATSIAQPFVAPRLSIVVLPFANLSDDKEQQYFADGITEDLTTALSQISDMFVISRNTAFTYKDKPLDTKQLGHELGVRYVLEGSVQHTGNRVRISAQLIDAKNDTHLWAERFDRDIADLFGLQREITGRIANTLNLELVTAEAARPTDNLDALDYILRGRAARAKPNSPEILKQAVNLFERALSLDPQSVEAQSQLANARKPRARRVHYLTDERPRTCTGAGRSSPGGVAALCARHAAKGDILRAQMRCEEAVPQFETALSLNPNLAWALPALTECKLFAGSIEEVIPLEEQAIRLSPRDPQIASRYFRIGLVHLLQSRTDEAILWLERARSANPELPHVHASLASAYGLKGETDRAAAELAEARRLRGEGSFPSIAQMEAHGYWGVPKIRALFESTYLAGLHKAGVPAE